MNKKEKPLNVRVILVEPPTYLDSFLKQLLERKITELLKQDS